LSSKSKEIKTAVLVLSSLFLLVWGYSFLKSTSIFQSTKTFYAVYDNVDGLLPKALVTLNGLNIGNIESIEFLDNKGKILVTLHITSDFPITKKSIAKIYEPGLIGGKQISIVPDYESKTLAETGDTLQSGKVPSLTDAAIEKLVPLQEKMEAVLVSADKLMNNINSVLSTKNKEEISKSLAELSQTLSNVKSLTKNADGLLADNKPKLDNTFKNLDKTMSNFSKLSDTLVKANLGQTVKTVEKTLANVNLLLKDLEAGKGTMGKLLKDEAMYNNLTAASKELELLLSDLKLNPKRYIHISVFGKTPKPYEAPKK
jgi:phospholipid/cholesterol/gamma-HCH transport system substrate-binding protein